jgi:hypothetical protein
MIVQNGRLNPVWGTSKRSDFILDKGDRKLTSKGTSKEIRRTGS